jgi:hypothetical protein
VRLLSAIKRIMSWNEIEWERDMKAQINLMMDEANTSIHEQCSVILTKEEFWEAASSIDFGGKGNAMLVELARKLGLE